MLSKRRRYDRQQGKCYIGMKRQYLIKLASVKNMNLNNFFENYFYGEIFKGIFFTKKTIVDFVNLIHCQLFFKDN